MPFGFGYGRQRRRSHGSGKLRLLIAAVIAIGGLITYYSRTSENPVTGEKQRVALSVDQEVALGLRAAPEMAQQMGGVVDPRRSEAAALVAEIGQRLVERSDARKSPYVGNYNFHLLADERTVNAFALPGGQIFITRALLSRMTDEAQLAAVLGHEIGHVINRHAAEHLATAQLGQSLVMAVGVAGSDEQGRGQAAAMAAAFVNQMIQLRYGRDDELESDRYGLQYMVQAGYDPSAMVEVMKILRDASGGARGPGWTQTHPDPEARIQRIEGWLKETYPGGVPRELTRGRNLE